jgi:HK97 family phage major capsid protein
MQLGARMLTDLVGNVTIPRQTSASAAQWVSEDSAAAKSTINFDQVPMNFKTVSANVAWSRQMLLQGLPAMETIMRADLASQLGLAIDLAAINGAGSGTIPRGILNTSGIGAVIGGTNGAELNYGHLVDLESAVAVANADAGNLGYLVNAKTRGHCKKTVKFGSGTEMPIWDGGSEPLNGYRAGVSNQVPGNLTKGSADGTASAVIFGNFSDLLIGMWGGLDLLLDPFSNSTTGRVLLTAFQSCDIAVRHPQSFAAMVDALTPAD